MVGLHAKSHTEHASGTRANHRAVEAWCKRGQSTICTHFVSRTGKVWRAVYQSAIQIKQYSTDAVECGMHVRGHSFFVANM